MSRTPDVMAIGSAHDLIPSIPDLLGHEPHHELVIVGVADYSSRPAYTFSVEIPPTDENGYMAMIDTVIARLGRARIRTVYLLGFGGGGRAPGLVETVLRDLEEENVAVRDAGHVTDGRYWSLTYVFPDAGPPDGVPVDEWKTPVSRRHRGLGVAAFEQRTALAAMIAPVQGAPRKAMRAATLVAEELIDDAQAIAPALAIEDHRAASYRILRWLGDHYATGGVLDNARAAVLTVALRDPRVRDEAVALAAHGDTRAYLDLWTDLARRADEGYRAPVLALLGFCAWRLGRTTLAFIAAGEAAYADRDGLARVLLDLLRRGANGRTFNIPAPHKLPDPATRTWPTTA